MRFSRAVVLAAVALVAAGLSGAAHLIARADVPALPGKPTAALALDLQVRLPDCSNQNDDDDRDEVKTGKPDLDDVELECGDQDDDDKEIEEDAPGKHPEREKSRGKHEGPHVATTKKPNGK